MLTQKTKSTEPEPEWEPRNLRLTPEGQEKPCRVHIPGASQIPR